MSRENEYYLLFLNGRGHWSNKLLKKGFQHIAIMMRDQFNWLIFDPQEYGLKWEILGNAAKDLPRTFCKNVLKITTLATPAFRTRIGYLSCVSVAKYVLGIYLPLCYTPWQLYKMLLIYKKLIPNIKSVKVFYGV